MVQQVENEFAIGSTTTSIRIIQWDSTSNDDSGGTCSSLRDINHPGGSSIE